MTGVDRTWRGRDDLTAEERAVLDEIADARVDPHPLMYAVPPFLEAVWHIKACLDRRGMDAHAALTVMVALQGVIARVFRPKRGQP